MSVRVLDRINDILDAIEQIEAILHGRSFADISVDRLVRAAYERFLEIISEASRHIPEELKAKEPEIAWRDIAAIGNHLRHGYRGLDIAILWDIYSKEQLVALKQTMILFREDLAARDAKTP